MAFTYRTKGVCSRQISFDIQDGRIVNIRFDGGCNGNTQGIASLAEGMTMEEIVTRLEGIRCGFKGTSCPDQLAQAVKAAMAEAAE